MCISSQKESYVTLFTEITQPSTTHTHTHTHGRTLYLPFLPCILLGVPQLSGLVSTPLSLGGQLEHTHIHSLYKTQASRVSNLSFYFLLPLSPTPSSSPPPRTPPLPPFLTHQVPHLPPLMPSDVQVLLLRKPPCSCSVWCHWDA